MKKFLKILILIILIVPVHVSALNKFYFECDETNIEKGKTTNCNLILESTDPIDSLYTQVKVSDETAFQLINFKKGEYGKGSFFETGKFGLYNLGNITGKNIIGTFEINAIGKSGKNAKLTFDEEHDGAYAYLSDDKTKVKITTEELTLEIEEQSDISEPNYDVNEPNEKSNDENIMFYIVILILIFIAFVILATIYILSDKNNKNNINNI